MITHPTGCFDNHALKYRRIEVAPLAAAMGAEVLGLQFADIDDETFAEFEAALFRHKMLFLRDQKLSHGDQEVFSRRFGLFAEDAYTRGVDGHPNVQPVVREADHSAGMIFGSGWHTDSPFLARPPAISLLFGIDIPPYGGDTIWANSALAYACLSDTMKAMIDDLRVHMSMRNIIASVQTNVEPDDSPLGRLAATRDAGPLPEDLAIKVRGNYHPLVRTHPVSGEKSLYCDGDYTVGIEGMTEAESRPLLQFLVEHITQPAFTCRLRWHPGTLTFWDNRLCIHQAFNDHQGFRREMYRTTIAGEAPG